MPQPYFSTRSDIKLIKLVRSNAVLYNPKHPKYSDCDSRELAWQKIGDAMGRPTQKCKSRWLNIRDMMRRTIRMRIQHPNEYNRTRKYRYEEDLAFMLPHFKLSKTTDDHAAEYLDESTGVQTAMSPEYKENLDFEGSSVYRERMDKETSRSEIETISQQLNPTDPLDVFLMAIGCSLKKFNPYYLNQAKSKIFQICQEYELQQITDKPG